MVEGSVTHTQRPAVTAELARYASGLRWESIPGDVRYLVRQCLLDWTGVTLAGSNEPLARILLGDALVAGGYPQATVLGTTARLSVPQAALVNGAASHALDFDDVHRGMGGHPTVPVAPAALALAEQAGATGAELITAFVAGFEVECRAGALVMPGHYAVGFHATATLGSLGSAAACARLLRLDPETTRHALGIAATQAAGLKAMFGTMCKPLHAGRAAVNGLTAATWAARGFTSNPDALETEQGFAATQTVTPHPELALDGLGDGFAIRDVLFKYHAACFGTHPAIEATLRLRQAHGIDPYEVAAIILRVPPVAMGMCNIPEPATALEGKFSLRFTTALALAGPGTADAHFTDEAVRDPRLVAIRDRVTVLPDPTIATGETEVRIRLLNGRELRERVDVDTPASDLDHQWRSLVQKFTGLAEPVVGRAAADRLVASLSGLDDLPSVRELTALCVPGEESAARQ